MIVVDIANVNVCRNQRARTKLFRAFRLEKYANKKRRNDELFGRSQNI